MAKLLVVDDESKIRELIAKYARHEGHDVAEAANGGAAVALAREKAFDLVLMDVMMPGLSGFAAVREIRGFSRVPVIMLSARSEEYDRITGFEAGVDDYVVKPFSPRELMMRIAAVLARTGQQAGTGHEVYEHKGLRVDFTARRLTVDGAEVPLTPREYELLFYMVRARGRALTRESLLCDVWGYDFYGDDRTLDTHIKMLRKALGPYAGLVVTLRGVGYRFDG